MVVRWGTGSRRKGWSGNCLLYSKFWHPPLLFFLVSSQYQPEILQKKRSSHLPAGVKRYFKALSSPRGHTKCSTSPAATRSLEVLKLPRFVFEERWDHDRMNKNVGTRNSPGARRRNKAHQVTVEAHRPLALPLTD
eukprot:745968-Hanusia_phi.AAC.2